MPCPLIADAFALYVKAKNYHWHVAGPHFNDYHRMLDEQAEAILGTIDILAERVRRIGRTTIRAIKQIGELQTIRDDMDEQNLLEDNQHMAQMQREAIEICDKNRDTPTGNRLQEILDQTEKRIWFLHHQVIQGAVRSDDIRVDAKKTSRRELMPLARHSRV